jgi:hypothetical protein
MMRRSYFVAAALVIAGFAYADGPADNNPDKVRPVPPPGIKIAEADYHELKKGVIALGKEIDELRKELAKKPALLGLLPDVQIFHHAVYYALRYDEFYAESEVAVARKLLQMGRDRAGNLRKGESPWNTETGPVVRGYQSRIDGSVQPYGIIVPESFKPPTPMHFRLDLWWHGRGEKLTELNFLNGRLGDKSLFVPNGFVLHPYGRYCNANHFAGEIDTLEAVEHARKHYPIDVNRIVARGYSMGGAACWGYAVHYPGLWVAAQPGAGFSETPEFLRVFQQETIKPNAWEKKLLHWYDCTDWAGNLYNVPTVAFSNAEEAQRQAADIMGKAMEKEGLHLMHVIAPGKAHKYPPPTKEKEELFGRIDSIVAKGRDPLPKKIKFTTYTLRYNSMRWVTIDQLGVHWERAAVHAGLVKDGLRVETGNVMAFTLAMPPGYCPLDPSEKPKLWIDQDQRQFSPDVPPSNPEHILAGPVMSDRSWTAHFRKIDGKWKVVDKVDDGELRKRHGLQGPIDDAFMDKFIMVKPTGTSSNEKVGKWVHAEFEHAVDHWRKQFRGELHTINDTDVDEKWIAGANLILWGDPKSNKVLAKIADKLPIRFDADKPNQVPVLIYPNPLNPKKYVVLNSGFTFREYDYLNNARQIPRLPDWAILDIDQPRTTQRPAGIVDAGFFDERWQLPAKK